LIDYTQKMQHT